METPPPVITLDQLKARAAVLGVTVRDQDWDAVHYIVDRGLAALQSVDAAELKPLEPTIIVRTVPAGA